MKATAKATLENSKRYNKLLHKVLGQTGLNVSACGFGAYRIDYRVKEHDDALEYALLKGINLIDTSSNYSDGGSEVLTGAVINRLVNEKKLKREEIVIVTKGGYIQGKAYKNAKEKEDKGEPYPDVVKYSEGLWHCIHPDFLNDEINKSLDRMKMDTIDVYLLHNPEYFLDSPVAKELSREELEHEYYLRIRKAFEFLEIQAEKGKIGCYGISSNSFVKERSDKTFTSLELCLKIAERIKPDNHFLVIEFPLNLYERGALTNKNQNGETKTLMEYALEKQMGLLINRPLNAITENGLHRLADFEVKNEYVKLQEAQIIAELNLLESFEEEITNTKLEHLTLDEKQREAIQNFLTAGKLLKQNWKNFGSIESFNDVKKQFLIPRVNFAFSVMLSGKDVNEELKNLLDKSARQLNKVIAIIESIYGLEANVRASKIHKELNKHIKNTNFDSLTLSQKAILLINSTEGVSCTLVGMRQRKYVDDVADCLEAGQVINAEESLKQLEIT